MKPKYTENKRSGVRKRAHVWIAEDALGHELPPGAQVHHVDLDSQNNARSNLVICKDRAYHELLHLRTRALDAVGNSEYRRCYICKQFDAPENLMFRKSSRVEHKECARIYRADRRLIGSERV